MKTYRVIVVPLNHWFKKLMAWLSNQIDKHWKTLSKREHAKNQLIGQSELWGKREWDWYCSQVQCPFKDMCRPGDCKCVVIQNRWRMFR